MGSIFYLTPGCMMIHVYNNPCIQGFVFSWFLLRGPGFQSFFILLMHLTACVSQNRPCLKPAEAFFLTISTIRSEETCHGLVYNRKINNFVGCLSRASFVIVNIEA